MRMSQQPDLHLTYCLNVHPGETWRENLAAIESQALAVRQRVAPDQPFGLGLRLSAEAARELARPDVLRALGDFLDARGLYVFTINGFPFGQFHGTAVKDDVYRPDWRDPARRDYTIQLVDILAKLLPDGVIGSISTVPLAYKYWPDVAAGEADMTRHLAEVALHACRVEQTTGRRVVLALEPEPDCLLETTDETIAFFNGPLARHGRDLIRGRAELDESEADEVLRRHLGVCVDAAHLAVEFEDPAEALDKLAAAGVTVGKVQLSAALELEPTDEAIEAVRPFAEPTYLHQTTVQHADGAVARYRDLADALSDPAARSETARLWRVHFHVPLFAGEMGALRSTRDLLGGEFASRLRGGACSNIEIETYTFTVLPEGHQPGRLTDGIAREFEWALGEMLGSERSQT
jgi:sugar phosphate isomerase/epimerase